MIYQKKTSDDIVVVGGEEAQEESIEKDIDVPINEVSTVVSEHPQFFLLIVLVLLGVKIIQFMHQCRI